MVQFGYNLSTLVDQANQLRQVRKAEIKPGDRILVKTRNSLYTIFLDEDGSFLVSGGWFDQRGLSPMKTTIVGCSWGGSVIKMDIVAACGLCLEFGNRVITSSIREIFVVPGYRNEWKN